MITPRAQRIELLARVLLELHNKGAFIGNTENVSESGVFFIVGYPPNKISVGDIGLLHIMPLQERRPLPCKVTRLTDAGIAIQFLEHCPEGMISRLVLAGKLARDR
ncbi:MAG: PilZ domain-containing protein [Magnetococcus sp. XQGC-1]